LVLLFKYFAEGVNHEVFYVAAIGGLDRLPPAPVQTVAGHCVQSKKGQIDRITMNTAELVAIEIVIVLGALILLGTVALAWAMLGPLHGTRKKGNSRNSRRIK